MGEELAGIMARLELQQNPPQKLFSDTELRRREKRRTSKAPGPMESVLDSLIRNEWCIESPEKHHDLDQISQTANVVVDNQGQIKINKTKFASLINAFQNDDKDQDIKKTADTLINIFAKDNYEDFAAVSLIANLSPDDQIPSVGWLDVHKGKDYYRNVKRLTTAFRQTLVDISPGEELSKRLKKELNRFLNKPESDFTEINKIMSGMLYDNFYPAKNRPPAYILEDFLDNPGAVPAVFALRKIYLIQTLGQLLNTMAFDKQKDFYLHSSDIWNKLQYKVDVYHELSKTRSFNPKDFLNLSSQDIINQMIFFVVEARVKNEAKDFSKRKIETTVDEQGERHTRLTLLDFLFPNQEKSVSFCGVKIPLTTYLSERNRDDLAYINVNSGDRDIALIPVPVETKNG